MGCGKKVYLILLCRTHWSLVIKEPGFCNDFVTLQPSLPAITASGTLYLVQSCIAVKFLDGRGLALVTCPCGSCI